MTEKNKLDNIKSDITEDSISNAKYAISDDDLDMIIGGAKRQGDNICSCGRGMIYKNGLCKHCFIVNENA